MRAIVALLMAIAAMVAAQTTQPAKSEKVQIDHRKEQFEAKAKDYIWAGDSIWSIEVQNRGELLKKQRASANDSAMYLVDTAPKYFNPVTYEVAQTIEGVVSVSKGYYFIRARVMQVVDGGILATYGDKRIFIRGHGDDVVDDQNISLIVKEDGTYSYISVMGAKQKVIAVKRVEKFTRAATADEIAEYFFHNNVKSFVALRPKLVGNRPSPPGKDFVYRQAVHAPPNTYFYDWYPSHIPFQESKP